MFFWVLLGVSEFLYRMQGFCLLLWSLFYLLHRLAGSGVLSQGTDSFLGFHG